MKEKNRSSGTKIFCIVSCAAALALTVACLMKGDKK